MVLWLLNSLYENMPEVGDLDKPKLVFFFDEAHLLFSDMPKAIVDHVIKVVKLIRSKGVGVYFVSQNPTDIPNEILSQLGCKIQHALHAYTPLEQKGIKAAAESFRVNPAFDTAEAIQNLGTGEALISVLDEKGEPSMVEKVKILPPQSRMGTITEEERRSIINNSPLADKYDEVIDDESAKEANDVVFKEQEEAKAEAERIKEEEKQAKEEAKIKKEEERIAAKEQREKEKAEREAERAKKNSVGYKLSKKVANKTADKLINKGLNYIFKGLFK
jgi:DNA helicase HerA-like ATPase